MLEVTNALKSSLYLNDLFKFNISNASILIHLVIVLLNLTLILLSKIYNFNTLLLMIIKLPYLPVVNTFKISISYSYLI